MGLDIFRWLKFRKKLEPSRITLINNLEKSVGSLGHNNISAMKNYVSTLTELEKEYDISDYKPKLDMYQSLLNNQKKNSSR